MSPDVLASLGVHLYKGLRGQVLQITFVAGICLPWQSRCGRCQYLGSGSRAGVWLGVAFPLWPQCHLHVLPPIEGVREWAVLGAEQVLSPC